MQRLRRQIELDLSRRGLPREKVLATVIRLLELRLIRVGNPEYARSHQSFGLTTLAKRHLHMSGTTMRFIFRGKSGVEHAVGVQDRRLARVMRSLRELPGQTLFNYIDEAGQRLPIRSEDVNAYIRAVMGEEFSAKGFRTWAGTLSAARILRDAGIPSSRAEARRVMTKCLRLVATRLGNTATVCRASYVHPEVLRAFEQGRLHLVLPRAATKECERRLAHFLETTGDGT